MKNVRKKLTMLLLMLVLCLSMGAVVSQAATTTATTSTKKLNGLKKDAKTGKYYYYVNGVKLKNSWKTINKKMYYFGSDGAAKTSTWYTLKVGSRYYSFYFNRYGVKDARYTKTIDSSLVKKMDAIIKTRKLSANTSSQKLNALKVLYNYVKTYYGYQRTVGFKSTTGWEYTYAKQIMVTNKKGSCYHFAAAYAFLVKRATGLPVRICLGTSNAFNASKWQPHAWCEVQIGSNWYTFDPNATKFSTRKINWYKRSHSYMEGRYYKTTKTVTVKL